MQFERYGERKASTMAFFHSQSLNTLTSISLLTSLSLNGERLFADHHLRPRNLFLLPRHTPPTLAFSRRRNQSSAVSSSPSKKKQVSKKNLPPNDVGEEDDIDEDAFEALFNMLEEDLKNDNESMNGDDISEEDIDKLQHELEEVLGVGDDDNDDVEMINSAMENFENDSDAQEEEEEEEEEIPVKLKTWQLRRLAAALKAGRRKTSIKSLAAELCLDRAFVLKLLRDPPPNLVMMSAALPDKPVPVVSVAETKPIEAIPVETAKIDAVKSKNEVKVPVHVMQQSWSNKKRLKKVHVETLERIYRRTKRPTNTMISSIVHVTNLPRKRVVKWFEDRRAEDGVPEHRLPYQKPVAETVSTC